MAVTWNLTVMGMLQVDSQNETTKIECTGTLKSTYLSTQQTVPPVPLVPPAQFSHMRVHRDIWNTANVLSWCPIHKRTAYAPCLPSRLSPQRACPSPALGI